MKMTVRELEKRALQDAIYWNETILDHFGRESWQDKARGETITLLKAMRDRFRKLYKHEPDTIL